MINGFMRVRCAICDRQVDEIIHRSDPATMLDVFEARCHGQVDTCTVDLRKMENLRGIVVLAAKSIAFARKQIDARPQ